MKTAPLVEPASPFEHILTNRTEGATALFEQFYAAATGLSPEAVRRGLGDCRAAFPMMATWAYAETRLSEGVSLAALARAMALQTEATIRQGSIALASYQVVLTLSNSSLVRRALIRRHEDRERLRKVLCLVSRPGGEGRQLVAALLRAGCQGESVADHHLASALDKAQAGVLGADMFDHEGFINKVGSRQMVRQAKRLNKPVLVLAERFKGVSRLRALTPEGVIPFGRFEDAGAGWDEVIFEYTPWQAHVRLIAA